MPELPVTRGDGEQWFGKENRCHAKERSAEQGSNKQARRCTKGALKGTCVSQHAKGANMIQSSADELCNSAVSSSSDKRKSEREGRELTSKGAKQGRSNVGNVEESGSHGCRVSSISCLAQEVAESTMASIAAAVAASGAREASVAASDDKAAVVAASVMAVCGAGGSRSGGGAARRMAIL